MVNTNKQAELKPGLSVIIICKNAAADIKNAVESVLPLSRDIVVYDSGSTDGTLELLKQYPVNVIHGKWEGFGKTRRQANEYAKNDWVFCVDSDEKVDEEMLQSIAVSSLEDNKIVYRARLRNFIGPIEMKRGAFGNDLRIRLFNRKVVNWDDAYVHEKPILPGGTSIHTLKGSILHRTATSLEDYEQKLERYAMMSGVKYFHAGRKPNALKYYVSPVFTFVKNYIFNLGFVEGWMGFRISKAIAHYTRQKYRHLKLLRSQK